MGGGFMTTWRIHRRRSAIRASSSGSARTWPILNRVANLEQLEARRFLSTSVLRIVAYNIEDDINGNTTPLPGAAHQKAKSVV
jgi:hypothetical protein